MYCEGIVIFSNECGCFVVKIIQLSNEASKRGFVPDLLAFVPFATGLSCSKLGLRLMNMGW